jgi:hypothetical protein
MPATIGISAASATSFSIDPSKTPITRDAMNAVTRLIASHVQRFWKDFHLAQPGLRQHLLLASRTHEIEHLVDRHAPDELVVGVDHRRRHEVVALERRRGLRRLLVLLQLDDRGLHDGGDQRLGFGDDELVHRQHTQQFLVAVDDEQLIGLRRQLVEAAQVTQHDFERDIGPHLQILEIHQRADHVVLEGHRRAQVLALLHREAREHVVHDFLREIGRQLGDLFRIERFRRGDQLLGVHRRDERLAHRLGDFEQDVAVATRAHEIPDVQPLLERERFEDVRNVGGVQPVELALELRLVLPGDEAFDDLAATLRVDYRRVLELLVDESFDQPVLAQQRGDLGERVLHAFPRFGALNRLFFDRLGHDGSVNKGGVRDAEGRILTRALKQLRRLSCSSDLVALFGRHALARSPSPICGQGRIGSPFDWDP